MACVTSPDGDTVLFKLLRAGIMQGDTLAPYLFIIVLGYTLRTALNGTMQIAVDHETLESKRVLESLREWFLT